ncbi:MAG: NfeD family protein [Xanthomonadales bacterium]|nr:NfeD family protein [Xanthomonadales bacterium]
MRWDAIIWAAIALLLFAAEAMLPGAFMLWMGIAASVVFLGVLIVPGMSILAQAVAFIALSFISIQAYRTYSRGREILSDQPALNRRTEQLVGRVVALDRAIERGAGRVQIADAYWEVSGPDLPAGADVRIVGAEGMTLRVEAVE